MEQYILKSALVAEIERIKKEECPTDSYEGRCKLLWFEQFLSFIDTLEVKEVDCEKAIEGLTVGWKEGEEYGELQNVNTNRCVTLNEVKEVMRCTYELGLKTQKVKEADLEKEWKEYFKYREDIATVNIKHLAKHFFELGLNAQKGE